MLILTSFAQVSVAGRAGMLSGGHTESRERGVSRQGRPRPVGTYWGINMGTPSSKREMHFKVKRLLEKQGTMVKEKTIEAFIKTIEQASPWFIMGGGLNILDWEEVCRDLQKETTTKGA